MADNMMKPLVTVIVPIFNGSKWISRCLDSLIYQTLKNIEIIAIDNGSTDNTWEILTAYSNKYAEKIFIKTIPHTNGPGGGRNVGLEMARANYIAFADIDDYFEYDAMESMYEKIVEGDYDIVYCASCDIKDGVIKKTRTLSTAEKSFVIQYGSMVFWNKLFKRDLFEKAGRIPENIVFEDIAYVSTLISLADKIGYIDKPLYHYILRDDSGVNDLSSDRILHALKAYDIAIENCDRSVRDELIASILYRAYYDLTDARWTYADKFIEYIKERREIFNNSVVLHDAKLTRILKWFDDIGEPKIPQITYHGEFNENDEVYEHMTKFLFRGNVATIELNIIDNCSRYENDVIGQLYKYGDLEELEKYFALKKIYESGGFYISKKVEIINPFDCFKYCHSVWGFEDKENFTDDVFGAAPKDETVKKILLAIEEKGFKVKEAIKYVLVMKEKISLNGKTQINNGIVVVDPTVFITNISGQYNISKIIYKENDEKYVTLKKSTLQYILRSD